MLESVNQVHAADPRISSFASAVFRIQCQLTEDIDKGCKISKEWCNYKQLFHSKYSFFLSKSTKLPIILIFLAFIIYLRIVYQFHCSLAMKLINLHARQIESVGRVRSMPAHSRAITRVSLKDLQIQCFYLHFWPEKVLFQCQSAFSVLISIF